MLKSVFVIPKAFTFLFILFTFAACEKEDTNGSDDAMGSLSIEITDAPIDDTSVEGVFVTVSEVKIDGQAIEGFQSKTIDIKAYQEGRVALLAETELAAKTYTSISLVLDHTTDASGNTPGCYVMKTDGSKEVLMAGSQDMTELTLSGQEIMVEDSKKSEIVIDFDLRKAIKREGQDAYDFVAGNELAASLRVVGKTSAGTISGTISDWSSHADKVIVYAYKKGTLDVGTETQGSGDGQLQFKNAVTSVEAKVDGNFELHFLESGDYEVYLAGYKDEDQDGRFELEGRLSIDPVGSADLSTIAVEANNSTRLDLSIIGILPL